MLFATIMGLGGLSMDIFRNSLKAELHHPIKINFFGYSFSEFSGASFVYAGVAVFGVLCVFVSCGTIKSVVKSTAFEA